MIFLPAHVGPPQFAFRIRFLIMPLLVQPRSVGFFCGRLLLYFSAKLCKNPKRMNTDKLRLMAPVSDRMNILINPPPPCSLTWVETYLYCISLCPAEAEEEWARCKHLTQSSSSISWYLSFSSSVGFSPCDMRFNAVSRWDNPKYRSQPL